MHTYVCVRVKFKNTLEQVTNYRQEKYFLIEAKLDKRSAYCRAWKYDINN